MALAGIGGGWEGCQTVNRSKGNHGAGKADSAGEKAMSMEATATKRKVYVPHIVYLNNEECRWIVTLKKWGAPTVADCGPVSDPSSKVNAKLVARALNLSPDAAIETES